MPCISFPSTSAFSSWPPTGYCLLSTGCCQLLCDSVQTAERPISLNRVWHLNSWPNFVTDSYCNHCSSLQNTNTTEAMQNKSNRLCEEVLLLISSARSKNIDISVWLTEDGSHGRISVPDFNSKLISLGLIVGMGESSVKKGKLDYATSDTSLGRILILCRAGKDSNGVTLIDVSKFLRICDRMLTSSINDSIVTSLSEYPLSVSIELDIAGIL